MVHWFLLKGFHPTLGPCCAIDIRGGDKAQEAWDRCVSEGVHLNIDNGKMGWRPYGSPLITLLELDVPESFRHPTVWVVQYEGKTLVLDEGGNEVLDTTFIFESTSSSVIAADA